MDMSCFMGIALFLLAVLDSGHAQVSIQLPSSLPALPPVVSTTSSTPQLATPATGDGTPASEPSYASSPAVDPSDDPDTPASSARTSRFMAKQRFTSPENFVGILSPLADLALKLVGEFGIVWSGLAALAAFVM